MSQKNIILSDKEINKVIKNLDTSVKSSIKLAFDRVKDFHKRQSIKSYKYFDKYKNELALEKFLGVEGIVNWNKVTELFNQ